MRRWARAVAGIVVGLCAVVVLPASPAAAACASSKKAYTKATPWAQRLMDPTRVWPLTTGSGVVVAVLGTGVDVTNPQLDGGKVRVGADLLAPPRSPATDCDGRGTFAAGIIAADPHDSTTFVGMAPRATILSIRYTEHQDGAGASNQVHPDRVAAAINAAVTAGADVICVIEPAPVSSAALRAAVARARSSNVVVVSPAKADGRTGGGNSYPTAEPSVLGVAALAGNGEVASRETGTHIDVAAPGGDLVSTAPGQGRGPRHAEGVSDPAFAAAYAAGAAALLRAYRPKLSADAVVERLRRTASGAAGNGRDPAVGWGVINPYAAVTAEGIDASASPHRDSAPTVLGPAKPVAAADYRARVSVAIAIGSIGLAALLGLGVQVYRRGRDRGWSPTRRPLADYDPLRNKT